MVKKQCCTYSILELLLQPAHKAVMPTATPLVPTVQIPVCQTAFGDHLFILKRQPKGSADIHSSPPLTNLGQFHITDLKMEDSTRQHSELGTIQSSPINLFLTVRIKLIWYFRKTYWTSQTDTPWQVRNHTGEGWTCSWLIQLSRLMSTKSWV